MSELLVYLVPAAIFLGIGTYINGSCVFGSASLQRPWRFLRPGSRSLHRLDR